MIDYAGNSLGIGEVVPVYLTETEINAPPYCALEIMGRSGTSSLTSNGAYRVRRATSSSAAAVCFNLGNEIEAGATGYAVIPTTSPVLARYDAEEGAPEVGTEVGTVEDEWIVSRVGSGFLVLAVDTAAETVRLRSAGGGIWTTIDSFRPVEDPAAPGWFPSSTPQGPTSYLVSGVNRVKEVYFELPWPVVSGDTIYIAEGSSGTYSYGRIYLDTFSGYAGSQAPQANFRLELYFVTEPDIDYGSIVWADRPDSEAASGYGEGGGPELVYMRYHCDVAGSGGSRVITSAAGSTSPIAPLYKCYNNTGSTGYGIRMICRGNTSSTDFDYFGIHDFGSVRVSKSIPFV